MIRKIALSAVLIVACLNVPQNTWASDPGPNLGGEDFVFLIPGLTGQDYLPPFIGRCNDTFDWRDSAVCAWNRGSRVDND